MGGSKPQAPQIIQAPAPPDVGKTAEESYQAQLKYNLPLAQNALDIQRQLGPGFAQSQYDITAQQAPLMKALMMQLNPALGTYEQSVNQRLSSPTGYDAQQQSAIDAIRQRSRDALSQQVRERSNLGGTLYGGRSIQNEGRALGELEQGFTAQDIGYQQQQQAANQQALVTLLQLTNPGVSQPNVPQFGQSVVPGGDTLYNALVQNQGNFGVIPGTPKGPSFLASLNQGYRG